MSNVRLLPNNERTPSRTDDIAHEKPTEIECPMDVLSVVFLDGKHVVGGGYEPRIRQWRVEDGGQVGRPMDMRDSTFNVAVSRDGKWIASGTSTGWVFVWNSETHEKMVEFKAYPGDKVPVGTIDISPDGSRIVTGSINMTAYVWSLSTGERLLGPLAHDHWVIGTKFSPDGRFFATTTWTCSSIRIYDTQNGCILIDIPLMPHLCLNQCFSWTSDSKHIFALSVDGSIHCLDVSSGTSLSHWSVHSTLDVHSMALARNGAFIAASVGSSVSFWDTRTHEQIGTVVQHTADIESLAISSNYDLAIGGGNKIGIHSLCDVLSSSYFDDVPRRQEMQCEQVEKVGLEETHNSHCKILDGGSDEQGLPRQHTKSPPNADQKRNDLVQSLRTEEESPSSKIARLEKTIEKLHDEQAEARHAANEKIDSLNDIIISLRANLRVQEAKSMVKILSQDKVIEELRDQLATSQRTANQEKIGLDQVIDTLCADFRARDESSGLMCNKIARLEQTNQELRVQLAESGNKVDSLIRIIHAFEQKHRCETLYAQGRIYNAAESLLEITNTSVLDDLRGNKLIIDWLAEFTPRCITALERAGDEASRAGKRDEAVAAYFAALSLDSSTPDTMLMQLATLKLISGSVHEVLNVAAKPKAPRFTVYRVMCDKLEGNDRLLEAVECFRQMQNELLEDTSIHDGQTQWELGFRARCIEKLEKLGDTVRDSKVHDRDEVIRYYSNALSLDPPNIYRILLKRSNEEIKLDPSSHRGYEGKYAALHGMGCHSEAFAAFKMMLLKLEQSPDPETRELHRQYVDATPTIKMVVEDTIRHMPRVLIDIATGHLHDKTQQAAAFEELPIYDELRSTMTTRARLDHTRIRSEVEKFYSYAMLSHKWQPGEPTFQMVENTSVYGLPMSPTNGKVQRFCELVRSLHFKWAWTDTCCVNQHDKGVHQESLVAMFRWYRRSSLTIVHLLGVFSDSQEVGCLRRSIWNTRGWTYQEYVASKVVQFYTEDWKPYLGLDMFNHKESPIILQEMEQAMHFTTQELAALQPGLGRVREKLFLASTRRTTREEDIAYSLFGIFNVAIPVIYGEGDRAVGRLLEHILTGSGDVTILAWTGRAGSYNSCLPVDLTVYNRLVPLHIPSPVETAEMDRMVTRLRSSLSDPSLAVTLHDQLNKLPSPSIAASRLHLAGIVFPVTELVCISTSDADPDLHVYRATTAALGDVEIQTTDHLELSGMENFVFIHPWISPLLDQEFSLRAGGLDCDCTTRALRLVARLRRPFGALLLKPLSRVQYKRVATDCLIMVQVREEISLDDLMDGIDTVDIQ